MSRRWRLVSLRCLCWLLSGVMAVAPSVALGEGAGAQRISTDAAVVVLARPRQLLTSPQFEWYPVEVLSAIGLKELGIDPIDVEQLTLFAEPPAAGPPVYAFVAELGRPFQLDQLADSIRGHTKLGELQGRSYLQSEHPLFPSFDTPDPNTLVVMADDLLRKLAEQDAPAPGRLQQRLLDGSVDDDLYVLVDVERLRPLITIGLAQAAAEMPEEFQHFLELPELVSFAELRLNFSQQRDSQLLLEATDEATAEKMEQLGLEALEVLRTKLLSQIQQQAASDDPIQRALASYVERMLDKIDEFELFEQEENQVVVWSGNADSLLGTYWTMGVGVAFLLPAVQAAREAARRSSATNQLKQIMLALLNHESTHGRFPARANFDDEGKPLLSWRVHILPYLEETALYEQFHLDEPWDSPHNRELIPLMPDVYRSPNHQAADRASYVVPVGEGLFMEGQEGLRIQEFRDGTSKTIALIECAAEEAPIWTQPEDWEADVEDPFAGVNRDRPGGFLAAFTDGSIRTIAYSVDPAALKAMLTRAAGDESPE